MTSHGDVEGEGFEMLGEEGTEEERKPQQEGGGPEGEEATGEPEQMRIDVYSVLRLSIAQLAGVAWQMMGLQADPFTNTMHKDAAQARVAIDAAAALVEQLKPHIQGQEMRDYQSLLTDLRMNFVTHLGAEQPKS